MRKYIIIYESAYDNLEKRVNMAMSNGWEPQGGVAFRPELVNPHSLNNMKECAFIQAMTKST